MIIPKTYLLDTDVLIEAKNRYYKFEVAPGFWEWLELANSNDVVFSNDEVLKELKEGNDRLKKWAMEQGKQFFLDLSEPVLARYEQVNQWLKKEYDIEDYNTFVDGADPFLIAHADVEKHYLVTEETAKSSRRNKIKIPAVCENCEHVNVQCIDTFAMLEKEGVRLSLDI